jgi:hypothetical protein
MMMNVFGASPHPAGGRPNNGQHDEPSSGMILDVVDLDGPDHHPQDRCQRIPFGDPLQDARASFEGDGLTGNPFLMGTPLGPQARHGQQQPWGVVDGTHGGGTSIIDCRDGNNDNDEGNDNDDDDDETSSMTCPLFMDGLPANFASHPQLAAIASLLEESVPEEIVVQTTGRTGGRSSKDWRPDPFRHAQHRHERHFESVIQKKKWQRDTIAAHYRRQRAGFQGRRTAMTTTQCWIPAPGGGGKIRGSSLLPSSYQNRRSGHPMMMGASPYPTPPPPAMGAGPSRSPHFQQWQAGGGGGGGPDGGPITGPDDDAATDRSNSGGNPNDGTGNSANASSPAAAVTTSSSLLPKSVSVGEATLFLNLWKL